MTMGRSGTLTSTMIMILFAIRAIEPPLTISFVLSAVDYRYFMTSHYYCFMFIHSEPPEK